MHEAALAQSVLELIDGQARAQGFARVKEIHLSVGTLASVEVEALRFGLDAATRGTIAEGARVVIDQPAGQGHCLGCAETVPLSSRADLCPKCGSARLMVTGGDELKVVDLLVD